MEKTLEWIMDWFESNTEADRNELESNIDSNYFEKGYIDSFEFINLIGDIEDTFGVQFSNDQFEDRTFSTISGLARIIEAVK